MKRLNIGKGLYGRDFNSVVLHKFKFEDELEYLSKHFDNRKLAVLQAYKLIVQNGVRITRNGKRRSGTVLKDTIEDGLLQKLLTLEYTVCIPLAFTYQHYLAGADHHNLHCNHVNLLVLKGQDMTLVDINILQTSLVYDFEYWRAVQTIVYPALKRRHVVELNPPTPYYGIKSETNAPNSCVYGALYFVKKLVRNDLDKIPEDAMNKMEKGVSKYHRFCNDILKFLNKKNSELA